MSGSISSKASRWVATSWALSFTWSERATSKRGWMPSLRLNVTPPSSFTWCQKASAPATAASPNSAKGPDRSASAPRWMHPLSGLTASGQASSVTPWSVSTSKRGVGAGASGRAMGGS